MRKAHVVVFLALFGFGCKFGKKKTKDIFPAFLLLNQILVGLATRRRPVDLRGRSGFEVPTRGT
jgi:hypothetical protein